MTAGRVVNGVGRLIAAAGLVATAVGGGLTAAQDAASSEILTLVNQARWELGLLGLAAEPSLDAVAADWARQLADSGVLAHNPQLSTEVPAGWSALGENVAQGQPDAASVHGAWMSSPGHRANILGDYTDIGIAFLAANGTTWAVEVFAAYPGHGGLAPPEASTPDPQPTEIVNPSLKPTFTLSPTSTPTPTATASAHPTASDNHGWIVAGVVICGLLALVAVLGVLALMRWTQSRR